MRKSFVIFIVSILTLSGVSYASAQTINSVPPLNPFTTTTTPQISITQRTYGEAIQITGLTTLQCLELNSSNILTTTTCGSGGGGAGTFSTTTLSGKLFQYPYTTLGTLLQGVATTSSQWFYDPNLGINSISARLTGTSKLYPQTSLNTATYHAFGDSITASVYDPSVVGLGYPTQIATDTNMTVTNRAIPGGMACDMDDLQIFPYENPSLNSNTLYTFMIGTNDAGHGTSYAPVYNTCENAAITWLTIPSQDKVFGQGTASTTLTGTWSNDNTYQTGIGIKSTTNGSTASFSITTTGSPIYAWYRINDTYGGVFTYSIDGTATTTLTSSTTPLIYTNNGDDQGVAYIRIPNVSAGIHTVLFTVTSATNASNVVSILGIGSYVGTPSVEDSPNLYVGGVIRGYEDDSINSGSAVYNGYTKANVSQLNKDGLRVYFVDTRNFVNDTTDIIFPAYGGIHPTAVGQTKLRNAFENTIETNGSYTNLTQQSAITSIGTNVGINEPSPQGPLDVQGTTSIQYGGRTVIGDDGQYDPTIKQYRWAGGNSNSYYPSSISTNYVPNVGGEVNFGLGSLAPIGDDSETDWMTLTESGLLGLNTQTPAEQVDMEGATYNEYGIKIGNSGQVSAQGAPYGTLYNYGSGAYNIPSFENAYVLESGGNGGLTLSDYSYTAPVTIDTTPSRLPRLTVTSYGYVGIGTTTPTAQLQTITTSDTDPFDIGSTNFDPRYLAVGSVGPNTSAIAFSKDEVSGGSGYILSATVGETWDPLATISDGFQWYNPNTSDTNPVMTLMGDTVNSNEFNHLGLGTTSPVGLLSVNPNGIIGPAFVVGSSTGTDLIVTNGGLVGIGTTSPSATLSVQSGGIGSLEVGNWIPNNAYEGISLNGDGVGYLGTNILSSPSDPTLYLNRPTGNAIQFQISNGSGITDQMTLSSAGNLGIGTTSPYATLSVAGNGVFNQQISANYYTATSTTIASTFPYASTTAISSSNLTSGDCVQASTGGLLVSAAAACGSGGGGTNTNMWATSTVTNAIYTNIGQSIGVASSSPWAILSVGVPTYSATAPMFAIGSSTSSGTTTPFIVASNGNVGIATVTPTTGFASGAATSTLAGDVVTGTGSTAAMTVNYNGNVSIATTSSSGILNIGPDSGSATTTIEMGKIQIDGYSSTGSRVCAEVVVTSWVITSGACNP